MDVSRETTHVATKPTCYDLANMLVRVAIGVSMVPSIPIYYYYFYYYYY